MKKELLNFIVRKKQKGEKMLAVLIDPDKIDHLNDLSDGLRSHDIDLFFVGGSLLSGSSLEACVERLKGDIPVVLFPGDSFHITPAADAVLLLSLISGRNPEMLIGKHVSAAPYLKKSNLEIIPTGYMVIDTGAMTSVSYMSQTYPLPYNKNDIAIATALAGEMLGLQIIYLDGGSGAAKTVHPDMVRAIRQHVSLPIIVGGGIKTAEQAAALCSAGADVIVVGNTFETHPELLTEIARAIHQ